MNRKQKIRLAGIAGILVTLCAATGFILFALKQNINLFYTPTQLLEAHLAPDQIIRVGGYVAQKSVHFDAAGRTVIFTITDKKNTLPVQYQGVLPNLFREGQGIVVTGKISPSSVLIASEVLAKHDEKYMPWPLEKTLNGKNKNAS